MLQKKLRKLCEKTYLYRLSLIGKEDLTLNNLFPDPWPPQVTLDINQLRTLLNHQQDAFWDIPYFASFEWIRDLKTSQDLSIRSHIRDIILFWIYSNQRFFSLSWSRLPWRPDIVGLRIWNTLALFDFYGTSGPENFKQTVIKSVTQQYKQLTRSWNDFDDPLIQFKAIKGIIGFLCSTKRISYQSVDYWQEQLMHAIEKQILADGGHKSRNPRILLFFLRDLIDIRGILTKHNIDAQEISKIINQVARIFR